VTQNGIRFGLSRPSPRRRTPPLAPWCPRRPSPEMPDQTIGNYLNLAALYGGMNANVHLTDPRPGWRTAGRRPLPNETISVGGSRIMFNHYTPRWRQQQRCGLQHPLWSSPPIDAIQEMEGANRRPIPPNTVYNSTQVNVVTKRRHQQLSRPRVFYFLRNNYAGLRSGITIFYPTPPPAALPYKYNDYGFRAHRTDLDSPRLQRQGPLLLHGSTTKWYSRISFFESGG